MTALLTTLLSTALLFGCSGDIEPGRTAVEAPIISGLPLATAAVSSVSQANFHVGTVESPDRGTLAARVDGRILRIAVRPGDRVEKGDLLLTLGDNQGGERLAEAEGARKGAAARLDLATKTQARYQELFTRSAVTPQEMDQINAELEMARQGLAQATAAVEVARTAAAYSRLRAPYSARVVRKLIEEGSTVFPGTPLLILDRSGAWRVRVNLPESSLAETTIGTPFTVEIPALGKKVDGRVGEILPAADPGTRSFAVKLDLDPVDGLSAGLFARVSAEAEATETIQIPATALVHRGQLTGIYIVEEGVLRYRLVKTGRTFGDRVEILSGLSAGESYVVDQTRRARSGSRVEG
jgi:RND family efflux transporter MFP subunit